MGNWRPWDGKLPDARRQFVDDSDSDFGSESESTVTQWSYISSSSDGGNATAIVNVEAMGSPHPENGLQFVKVTFNDGSTDIQQSQEFNDLLNDWNDASEGNAITQPPNSDVTSAAPVESESDEEDSELLTREEDERLTAAQGGKEETQESREAWARQQESFEESKKNGQNLIQEESEESESAPENVGDEIRLAEENPDVGEKSDLEYEFSEGKEVAPGEQSSPALEELDVVDGPGEKAFQLSEKGWGRGLLEAWIIQETVAVLTVMTLLDGFGDEKGKKFAAGAAQFDRVAEELAKAVAGQGWQGVAAQAYATRNSEVHWVALQMADADKRMRRLLERHGEQVTETREVLGTFTAFLGTVCMAVAVGLAKMGRYEASLIFQISVCSAALGACGGAQGKLIAHSKKTAAGVDGAISSYQRLAAQLRSGARGFGLPHGGDKGWVIDAGG
ncbi:EspA/EspE family type VII secretion system effector, partial [Mycobacterium pseudokansasii]